MNNRALVIILLSMFSFMGLKAQDIHFSQFYMSPLNLNPAMTGVMNCTERYVANYRSQWATYNTFSASYDRKIAVGRADYIGIGGTAWADIAGAGNFGTTQGRLSFSFSKQIGGSRKSARYIVAGVDAGFSQRRISPGDLLWPGQHNGEGGIETDGTGVGTITDPSFLYPDLAGGLLYFDVLNEKNNYYLGASMHHLNQANVSFLNGSVSLFTKLTVHGGGEFELTRNIALLPGFVFFKQGPHRQYNLGSSFRFGLSNGRSSQKQSFQAGLWFRSGGSVAQGANNTDPNPSSGFAGNAMILSTRFDYENYGFGFSYDYNLSDVNIGGGAGSFEFSMVYYICGNDKRGIYCPTF